MEARLRAESTVVSAGSLTKLKREIESVFPTSTSCKTVIDDLSTKKKYDKIILADDPPASKHRQS